MSINPSGMSTNKLTYWNYSNPNKENYSPVLEGVVIALQEKQKHVFGQPGVGEFWPDGKPKMNIRIALAKEDGTIVLFEFQPASKAARMGQRRSIHMDLYNLAGGGDIMNLLGRTIILSTQEGQYGAGNPRPFFVEESTRAIAMPEDWPAELKVEKVLLNNSASGGQVQAPAMVNNQYAAPTFQYAQQFQSQMQPQQYAPQPQYQQPYQPQPQPQMQQQYAPQPQPQQWQQQVQQQYPGMQVQQVAGPYEDMPF